MEIKNLQHQKSLFLLLTIESILMNVYLKVHYLIFPIKKPKFIQQAT